MYGPSNTRCNNLPPVSARTHAVNPRDNCLNRPLTTPLVRLEHRSETYSLLLAFCVYYGACRDLITIELLLFLLM